MSIEETAKKFDVPLIHVRSLNTAAGVAAVSALSPDIAVHAGAGILRSDILKVPRLGTINAHMGILPRYRGMNVAEWSALEGGFVGCSVHLIDEGIDTGDIMYIRHIPLSGVDSIDKLRAHVNLEQINLLSKTVAYIASTGQLSATFKQNQIDGRQYFKMHHDLRNILDKILSTTYGRGA